MLKDFPEVSYVIVNESGASVYSASELARQEFPELTVEKRSAISIARRLQDPLAELVKIDPKSIGVGQYQHDVSQKKLSESLDFVVDTVVNQVGVNINTASPALLSHVAGLNKTISENIRNGFNSSYFVGDLGGIRTPDPRLRRPLLYPTELPDQKLERAMGIEPTTSAWKAEVLPLNYTRNLLSNALCIWSERQDSNLRPPAPKAGALPS